MALPKYNASNQENFVFTDELWTKQIISDFYESYCINFRNFRLRKFAGKSHKDYRLGCVVDGFSLFAEIYLLVPIFKKELLKKTTEDKYNYFFILYEKLKNEEELVMEEFYFILEFTNLFMNVSGMKNISRVGDDGRPGFLKKT